MERSWHNFISLVDFWHIDSLKIDLINKLINNFIIVCGQIFQDLDDLL